MSATAPLAEGTATKRVKLAPPGETAAAAAAAEATPATNGLAQQDSGTEQGEEPAAAAVAAAAVEPVTAVDGEEGSVPAAAGSGSGANDGEEEAQLDAELVLAIERLQEVQDELERVNEEASDKVLEVEQRYNEVRRPVYARRNAIITSIPDFWLTAFLSHPQLADLLTEDDQKAFKHLAELEVEDSKDVKSGYRIALHFRPNPYFEDEVLEKVVAFAEDGAVKVTGTPPRWKPGMVHKILCRMAVCAKPFAALHLPGRGDGCVPLSRHKVPGYVSKLGERKMVNELVGMCQEGQDWQLTIVTPFRCAACSFFTWFLLDFDEAAPDEDEAREDLRGHELEDSGILGSEKVTSIIRSLRCALVELKVEELIPDSRSFVGRGGPSQGESAIPALLDRRPDDEA
eukprot:SM000064S19798  [mRNA]  locus=s64:662304:664888:+ [translate_table: standard]